ncbi:MAG: sigma-54 dependent transcriptional regulator [Bacteroidales bacterium]|nr:sigma-54 dependent transcriptional regulator [Bacteroidales bacterium]
MADILLVDDQTNPRRALSILLSKNKEYNIEEAENGQDAIDKLKDKFFDLIITDVIMEPVGGIEVLKHVKEYYPTTEVIVITAYGTVESGVDAMKLGAYDYIQKPFNTEEFTLLVERALEKRKAAAEVKYLRGELREKYKFENIIGNSEAMNKVFKLISQVARTDSTILISGENGTGKELVAKAIHVNSSRGDKPMITINIGSLPETLLDSELFGHVKGSFTGAVKDKKGLFQEADMGTIFLDEIGDCAPQTQVRLLRFLQDGEIRRIGDNQPFNVDVRLISASNKNLEEEVKNNKLREDLYYRLNVIPLHLPPLRERKEDIPLLINHFLHLYSNKLNKEIKSISPAAMSFFIDYHWPGNVRELENVIERSVTLCTSKVIESADLAPSFPQKIKKIEQTRREKKDMTLEEMEKWLILDTLELHNGNQKLSAQKLGISTTTLWRKLKHYGIDLGEKD